MHQWQGQGGGRGGLVMAVSNCLPVLKEDEIVDDVKRDEESVAP